MNKILLFHGAWHNKKCWDSVITILEKNGYEAEAFTLPGNGEGDSKDVTYNDYVDYVCKVVKAQKDKVIVVAHSSAGHIMQMALPNVEGKICKVIFNNSWILPDGKSQFDLVPDEIKNGMIKAASENKNGAIPIDPGFVKGLLANEADEKTVNDLLAILVDQPLCMLDTPINSLKFASLKIPKVLLHNTKDISAEPGTYLNMFKALGDNPVIENPCDHEGLFTNPEVYTESLIKAINT